MVFACCTLIVGCTSTSTEENLKEKQAQLQELKAKISTKNQEIDQLKAQAQMLEQLIQKEAPTMLQQSTKVTVLQLQSHPFRHEIEVRGSIQSDKNIVLSAEASGRINKVYAKIGQQVSTGALLMRIDTELLERSLAEIEKQLSLAQVLYERQKNLWEEKIGTEIQYLTQKNQYESLQKRRNTLQTQIEYGYVRAPFSGIIEQHIVKEGEFVGTGQPLLRMLNPDEVYVEAAVADAYIPFVKQGSKARMHILSTDQQFESTLSYVGRVLNNENRTFTVRMQLLKEDIIAYPNQVAVLYIEDYSHKEALVLPSRLVQKGDEKEFVFRITEQAGKKYAEKVFVKTGFGHHGQTEILEGLNIGDEIIDQGALEILDHTLVEITSKTTSS